MKSLPRYLAIFFAISLGVILYRIPSAKPQTYVLPELREQPVPPHPLLAEISKRNNRIQGFQAEVTILVRQKFSCRVRGVISMEKPKNFRMTVKSIVGQEMDLGSNSNLFWFWSRRMDPPAIHFSEHRNLSKTNLRTPLNPTWIMESFGIDEIKAEKCVRCGPGKIGYIEDRSAANGEKVSVLTVIDEAKKSICGKYLYDSRQRLTASSEISHDESGFPSSIFVVWHEENLTMEWTISKIKKNPELPTSLWRLPNFTRQIDMSKS